MDTEGGWAGARSALFAAGIAGESLAGRLLRLVIEAGAELQMARYELTARLAASESGLRYALLKLRGAGLLEYRAVRGVLTLGVDLQHGAHGGHGARQRELFGDAPGPAPRDVASSLAVTESVSEVVAEVVTVAEREAAPARRPAETELGVDKGVSLANAQRESAARSRRVAASAHQAHTQRTKHSAPEKPQAIEIAEVMKQFPHLAAGLEEPAACGVHSPIPHSPPSLVKQDIPSGGNVERRAETGIHRGRGGQLAAWKRKICGLVQLDPRYPWLAWSAALLAIDGPLSEHVLAGCVEGSGGHGGKFVAALKRRLAECDLGELAKRSLADARGQPRLHRFDYLRPRLAEHGIQLRDEDTQLVRTRRRA